MGWLYKIQCFIDSLVIRSHEKNLRKWLATLPKRESCVRELSVIDRSSPSMNGIILDTNDTGGY